LDFYSLFEQDDPKEQAALLGAALRGQQNVGSVLAAHPLLAQLGQSMLQRGDKGQGMLAEAGQQKYGSRLQKAIEDRKLQSQLEAEKRERQFTLYRDGIQNREAEKRARIMALQESSRNERERQEKVADEQRKASVPGLEIVEGANPTPDDAKKMKSALQSQRNIESEAKVLEDIYRKKGTELVGEKARRMEQALVAMQLEAKNVAELGALSGPDQLLMEKLASMDPTSLKANIKGLFGTDDTMEALAQFRSWAKNRVESGKQTFGYRDAATMSPAQPSAPSMSPEDAAALEWARANPNDPRAAAIVQSLGGGQ
jgi:hypothetical protein